MKHLFNFLLVMILVNQLVVFGQTESKVNWNKYDFLPGDLVIFEDNQLNEKNGEFPSRWDLSKGTIENASFEGENVIYFIKCNSNGGGGIVPLLTNSKEDYLPDEFTIEFDAYFEKPGFAYNIYLLDFINQRKMAKRPNDMYIRFTQNSVDGGGDISTNYYPGTKSLTKSEPGWRHIALSFNKRALKVYLDDSRIINIPNIDYNPTGVTLSSHNTSGANKGYVKNFRIAKGGVPLYEKSIQNGKFVTTGIKFDINKATIKPESIGVINYVYNMLLGSPSLKFRIEGHTDSDGDEKENLLLSEKRAKAILDKLVELGIDSKRLDYKGMGENNPMDKNNTPEGKANNRRVEFISF